MGMPTVSSAGPALFFQPAQNYCYSKFSWCLAGQPAQFFQADLHLWFNQLVIWQFFICKYKEHL